MITRWDGGRRMGQMGWAAVVYSYLRLRGTPRDSAGLLGTFDNSLA